VLVKVLRVGVDGTDKEINAAEYGAAPEGYDFLVLGHESFGRVESVGPNVSEVKPGDYVVATVRRPGSSIYDLIGTNDMTTDDTYFERGINLRHGYLTEYYVDDAEFIVKVPRGLKEVGVLLEPSSVVEKGIAQAYEIQRRLRSSCACAGSMSSPSPRPRGPSSIPTCSKRSALNISQPRTRPCSTRRAGRGRST
jgi:threonine dehydrogenase-like Zn-dependent dehydrogenase